MKYLVVYYKSSDDSITMHLWPGKTEEECESKYSKISSGRFAKDVLSYNIVDENTGVISVPVYKEVKRPMIPIAEKPKKEKELSKAEMKKILQDRGVRVYYHDTIEILKKKLAESEK